MNTMSAVATGEFVLGECFLASAALSLERSEEHTSELQSQSNLVCRLLLEKKKKTTQRTHQMTSRLPRYHDAGELLAVKLSLHVSCSVATNTGVRHTRIPRTTPYCAHQTVV